MWSHTLGVYRIYIVRKEMVVLLVRDGREVIIVGIVVAIIVEVVMKVIPVVGSTNSCTGRSMMGTMGALGRLRRVLLMRSEIDFLMLSGFTLDFAYILILDWRQLMLKVQTRFTF